MYSEKLLEHFHNPRNTGSLDKDAPDVGTGIVGAAECGDVMQLQVRVDASGVIAEARFKTFGCAAAIAASSLVTEWLRGRSVSEAEGLKDAALADELSLPPDKMHCSVLAADAVKAAVADWRAKQDPAGNRSRPPAGAAGADGAAEPPDATDRRLVALRAEAERVLLAVDGSRAGAAGVLSDAERRMLDAAVAVLKASLAGDDPDPILLALEMVNDAAGPAAGARGDRAARREP